MPHRIRDNSGKLLSNTTTASNMLPSLFFSDSELEDPLGEKTYLFGEPIEE